MWTKDFASKFFIEVLRRNSPSMINQMSLSSFTHESAETEEHFREIHN